MAFIGNSVQNQGFAPAVDYFNGDGTTVTFTLSRPVASVAQLTAVIENVIQNPTSAFTVSGNQITFTSAPPAGTNNIWIEYTSLITQYNGISQDPSVVGDITASGGYLSTGDFGNSYLDGTIVDYVTGMSRITTGASDGITLYNGGTSARSALMTLDSSGNVGIGTTSPSNILDISRSQNGATEVWLQNTNAGGSTFSNYRLINSVSSGGAGVALFGGGYSSGGMARQGGMYIYTQGSNTGGMTLVTEGAQPIYFGTNNTERMRIDSSGRVTTPYQPMFHAYPSTGGSVATATVLPFNATYLNVGSSFNTSTYRFTAPIAGTYYFVAQPAFLNPSNTRISLRVNTVNVFLHEQAPVTGWQTLNISFIITLAANDYVDVYNTSGATYTLDPGAYSSFMGFLVG